MTAKALTVADLPPEKLKTRLDPAVAKHGQTKRLALFLITVLAGDQRSARPRQHYFHQYVEKRLQTFCKQFALVPGKIALQAVSKTETIAQGTDRLPRPA